MQNKNTDRNNRVCLACGQVHQGTICPLIKKKLNKYANYKKKNYLIGNIFLKCIEKQVDFLQILREIVEQNERVYDVSYEFNTILPIESSIEYFAVSLGCSSRDFFKDPQKTLEEYKKLLFVSYSESPFIARDENSGKVDRIDIPFEISAYTEVNTVASSPIWGNTEYTYTLSKERKDDDKWEYNLYMDLPAFIIQMYKDECYKKKIYPYGRTYYFSGMRHISATDFLLASDYNGILKEIFEDELNFLWTDSELILDIPLKDERYEIWSDKLLIATRKRLLQWDKYERETYTEYSTFYEQTEIQLHIHKNLKEKSESKIYFENLDESIEFGPGKKHSGSQLFIRNSEAGLGVCFRDTIYDEKDIWFDSKATTLAKVIDLYIADDKKGNFYQNLKVKKIEHTDVIVMTYSMICHDRSIVPLRGIVQLLTDENKQMGYELYVGYCSECNKYYCFIEDCWKMLTYGKPLCAITRWNATTDKKSVNPFRYKSQSVLNAMGYSVGIESDLTVEERQKILSTALQSGLFDVHDLISFLNWLIQTRKTQAKYTTAIGKWQEDLDYVKNYELEKRQKVNIEEIIIRK